jgi:uncharacterized membrane protein YraQ (UPF0718 family)
MIIASAFLFVMTVVLLVVAYRRRDGSHIRGLKSGGRLFVGLIPLLLLAFLIAGLIQVAIPQELIRSWLSKEAGWRGIIVGTVAGALIPGGPYMSFPIIAAIVQAGASIGTAVALITGWAVLGVGALPFESALMGPRFMAVRLCCVFFVPPITGFIAQYLFGGGF